MRSLLRTHPRFLEKYLTPFSYRDLGNVTGYH